MNFFNRNLIIYLLFILFKNNIYINCKLSSIDSLQLTNIPIITNNKHSIISIELLFSSSLFFVNINLGSQEQRMQFVFDTQRNYISVMTNNCLACKEITTFDDTKSTTLKVQGNYTIEMYKSKFVGRLGTDNYKLNDDVSFKNQNLILVDEIVNEDSFRLQGYFGLGFTQHKEDNLLYYLKSQGAIQNAAYSLLMRGNFGASVLHLGGYDRNLINDTDSSKILYTNVTYTNNDTFTNWYLKATTFYLNNNLSQEKFNHKIILNSASNLIRIPGSFFFENLNQIFNKKSECQIGRDNIFHCRCNNDYDTVFPTFTFTLDGPNNLKSFNITIKPDDYIMLDNTGIMNSDTSAYCVLFLSPNYVNDYWILGSNYMSNYYLIFDIENSKVGFYDVAYIDLAGIEDILFLSLIIVFSSILFFSILHCIYKRLANRSDNNNNNENLIDN